MSLHNKTIAVGVCGGISAYKTASLVSELVKSGADVQVIMTRNATQFVAPLTFETLSHNRVITDTFERDFLYDVKHISLAKRADALIIAPATANIIAKLANGIADDFLSTEVLACTCPIIIAPAMNTAMLNNVATHNNIRTLEQRGFGFVYGKSGHLACGDNGAGRMAESKELFDAVRALFDIKRDYAGKTVLVTSGATRQNIDPVRYLTNKSSGKMGFALAMTAYNRGANVIYVKGFTDDFAIPSEFNVVNVETTSDMLNAVKQYTAQSDFVIMAAAPCDYEIVAAEQKIKTKEVELKFTKAPDCAAWVGEHKKAQTKLIIFAAETSDCIKNAKQKLAQKNADMVVLNDVTAQGAGFNVDTNIVTIITDNGQESLPLLQKTQIANILLDRITKL